MTGILVLRALAIVVSVVVIPAIGWFGFPSLRWTGVREMLLRRRMKREGRFVCWHEVHSKLKDGDGELECRRSSGSSGRFWYWPNEYANPLALLTDCPLRFWYLDALRSELPNAKLRETHLF